MADTSDIRKGLTVKMDGAVYKVVDFLHVKPGKGQAFVRTKFKNMETGAVIEKNLKSGTTIYPVRVEEKSAQYLYRDGDYFIFMDLETYEQHSLPLDQIEEEYKFLKDGLELSLLIADDKIIGIKLPNFVELKIIETDPGVRGDTAQGGTKPAKVETGAIISVPLFVEEGEIIRVDTRTGAYVERVKK